MKTQMTLQSINSWRDQTAKHIRTMYKTGMIPEEIRLELLLAGDSLEESCNLQTSQEQFDFIQKICDDVDRKEK